MKKLILLLGLLLLSALPAMADGPFTGFFPNSGGAGDLDFQYLGNPGATPSALLNNERILSPSSRFSVTDNGAGNTLVLELTTVPLTFGGTGATTQQGAVNAILNFAGKATGDLVYFDGTNWVRLPIGTATQVLTTTAGIPTWSSASVSAPANAEYIVGALDGTLSAERVLTGTTNKITVAFSAGLATLNIGSDVVTTTGSQVVIGKFFSNDTNLTDGLRTGAGGLGLGGTTFVSRLNWADWAAARSILIPDPGTANASFLLTESAQTKAGVLTLSAAPVLSTNTLTGGANLMTFPGSAQTLVGRTDAVTLTNKELGSGTTFSNAGSFDLVQTGGNYTISWENPAAARAYRIPEVGSGGNGDFVISIANATYAAGSVAFGNGTQMSFTSAGTSGHPLVSTGSGTPAFGVLGMTGGGTNIASYTAGDILVANDAGTLVKLPQGTNTQVLTMDTTGDPNIKWATPSAGSGTVTDFSAAPSGIFDVATSTSTPALTLDNQNANIVLAGPSSGGAATPGFRALVANDIPNLAASKITSGTLAQAQGGTAIASYTAGDILVANDAGTLVVLAQGTNGQALVVDTTGNPNLKWATPAGAGDVVSTGNNTYSVLSVTNDFTAVTNLKLPINLADPASSASDVWTNLSNLKYWGSEVTPVKHVVVNSEEAQTIAGVKTFSASPVLSTATLTANSDTITIQDLGNANLVQSEGAQTVNGVKTFGSAPVLSTATFTTNSDTITVQDLGNANLIQSEGAQTINGVKTFGSTMVLSTAAFTSSSDTITIQDLGNANVCQSEGTQTWNGTKTFGTLPVLPTQTANTVFSGPTTGSAAAPTFRALVTADMPAGLASFGGSGIDGNLTISSNTDDSASYSGLNTAVYQVNNAVTHTVRSGQVLKSSSTFTVGQGSSGVLAVKENVGSGGFGGTSTTLGSLGKGSGPAGGLCISQNSMAGGGGACGGRGGKGGSSTGGRTTPEASAYISARSGSGGSGGNGNATAVGGTGGDGGGSLVVCSHGNILISTGASITATGVVGGNSSDLAIDCGGGGGSGGVIRLYCDAISGTITKTGTLSAIGGAGGNDAGGGGGGGLIIRMADTLPTGAATVTKGVGDTSSATEPGTDGVDGVDLLIEGFPTLPLVYLHGEHLQELCMLGRLKDMPGWLWGDGSHVVLRQRENTTFMAAMEWNPKKFDSLCYDINFGRGFDDNGGAVCMGIGDYVEMGGRV